MKLLFIIYSFIDNTNGISKKVQAQVEALKNNGIDVELCHQMLIDGVRYWAVNGDPIAKIGSGFTAMVKHFIQFKPLLNYIKANNFQSIYMRYVHNATPFLIHFLHQLKKCRISITMEIPTYPYDGEYAEKTGFRRIVRKLENSSRLKFKNYVDKIVTFSSDAEIFGIPTIRLSNAVDFNQIPLRSKLVRHDGIKLIGVANINFWHGFDRIIGGLGNYYRNPSKGKVRLTLVGDGEEFVKNLKEQADREGVSDYVEFKGRMSGHELDKEFEDANLCIGCLACHRKNIDEVKSLKNVEYAARGIPMVYSEKNYDFDSMPYVIKVSADDSPIDINYLITELGNISSTPEEIRNSISNLSWQSQMNKVADCLLINL